MASGANGDRLKQAVEMEKKARDLHNAGQFAEANRAYLECLKVFQFVYKYETNPKVKDMVRERIEELVTTAENLKKQLSNAPSGGYAPPGGAAAAPRPGGAPGGGGGTPGGNNNEEAKDEADLEKEKLQKALAGQIVTEKPNIKWDDVAGLNSAKEMLQETVVLPTRFPQLFTGKRKPWKGILLYGPPGTGKSFLAKACATEVDATFYAISSSDLVSKWQGESEKNVRTLFEMARASRPSIVFVDEVDSLCGARGDGESEAARRIKTEFLAQMDGVGKDDGGAGAGKQLLILGATNTPWDLDSAIRRRFEKRIFISLPEVDARVRMLELNLGDTPHEVTKEDLRAVAERCVNFSGADLAILTRDAIFEPLRRCRKAKTFNKVTSKKDGKLYWSPCSPGAPGATEMTLMDIPSEELLEPPVLAADFETALEHCKSSISLDQLKEHEAWTEQFGMEG